jgi:hypothetical protein
VERALAILRRADLQDEQSDGDGARVSISVQLAVRSLKWPLNGLSGWRGAMIDAGSTRYRALRG